MPASFSNSKPKKARRKVSLPRPKMPSVKVKVPSVKGPSKEKVIEVAQRKATKYVLIFIGSTLLTIGVFVGFVNMPKQSGIHIPKISKPSFSLPQVTKYKGSVQAGELADPWQVMSRIESGEVDGMALVDMRSKDDYAQVHLQETVNIPFPYEAATEEELNTFIKAVKALKAEEIILMPYSTFSTSGVEAQDMLSSKRVDVSLLNIGWNELYNLPNMWVPEAHWGDFSIIDLIDGVQ